MAGLNRSTRAKTGCITCRIRRVKCDEGKPECQRCQTTGRKCDGYSNLPFSRRDLHAASQSQPGSISEHVNNSAELNVISKLVTDPAFSDVLDKRYFQFFRQRTVPSTNSLVDSRFWDRVVLQACHTEPAVKHAVLALSSWHQLSDTNADPSTMDRHRHFADRQYQLALHEARQLISSACPQDIDRVLIACIIFICFEGVRGNYRARQLHMDSGRAIARQHADRFRQASRRNDLREIQQTMARMDIPALTFSDLSSPYRYTTEDFMRTDPILAPWEFKDIYEARMSMIDLSRWFLLISFDTDRTYLTKDISELAACNVEKERCVSQIKRWYQYFERVADKADSSAELLVLSLRQMYYSALALECGGYYGPETRYDAATPHFEAIVGLGEQIVEKLTKVETQAPSFSYDIGYTMSMFLTATRCRHSSLRRRAINVLRILPRQEGLWASIPAAAIAQRWMEIEEEGLGNIELADDVPEANRVRHINTAMHVPEQTADLVFHMLPTRGVAFTERLERVRWA